ncbi:MAG: DUF2670 domain-containing protein [Rickettsiaceae bacterium]|nr:DUF2670 domain-containing protein [Rickettsiaceae bacterium]
MFTLFLSKLKILLKNPMVLFIYGVMSKWYIMIMLTAVVVTYWVFQGLTDAGVLQEAEKIVSRALRDTKSVARYCVPKIANLGDFWRCLDNPPHYEETKEEKEFEKGLNELLDINTYEQPQGPYAE